MKLALDALDTTSQLKTLAGYHVGGCLDRAVAKAGRFLMGRSVLVMNENVAFSLVKYSPLT